MLLMKNAWMESSIEETGLRREGVKRRVRIHMEKAMAPHSSTLAWKIPWTEEPGRLQTMGSRRVRQD